MKKMFFPEKDKFFKDILPFYLCKHKKYCYNKAESSTLPFSNN